MATVSVLIATMPWPAVPVVGWGVLALQKHEVNKAIMRAIMRAIIIYGPPLWPYMVPPLWPSPSLAQHPPPH